MTSGRIAHMGDDEYEIRIERAPKADATLVRSIVDMDLRTFAEPTFNAYTAAALLRHGFVFLMRAGDAAIGNCVCLRCYDAPNDVLILSIAILPAWRGQGLGHHFVNTVMDRLARDQFDSAWIMVSSNNTRAIRLYEESGFRAVDSEPLGAHGEKNTVTLRRLLRAAPRAPSESE